MAGNSPSRRSVTTSSDSGLGRAASWCPPGVAALGRGATAGSPRLSVVLGGVFRALIARRGASLATADSGRRLLCPARGTTGGNSFADGGREAVHQPVEPADHSARVPDPVAELAVIADHDGA